MSIHITEIEYRENKTVHVEVLCKAERPKVNADIIFIRASMWLEEAFWRLICKFIKLKEETGISLQVRGVNMGRTENVAETFLVSKGKLSKPKHKDNYNHTTS
jgi:hypothetical protein